MSIVEIAPTCPQCDDSASSCSTCGGYLGWPNPPNDITLGPCRKCVEGIAAASMSLEQLEAIATNAGQSPEQAEVTALQMLAVASGALPHSPEALAIAAGGDDELILVDDEPDDAGKMFARLAVEAVNAKASAEWEGDDEAPTEVLDRADVIAQLAPIEETWRKTWTECADLLKAVAEKDPAAAAGYVARCRDWLTRAVQYGS